MICSALFSASLNAVTDSKALHLTTIAFATKFEKWSAVAHTDDKTSVESVQGACLIDGIESRSRSMNPKHTGDRVRLVLVFLVDTLELK